MGKQEVKRRGLGGSTHTHIHIHTHIWRTRARPSGRVRCTQYYFSVCTLQVVVLSPKNAKDERQTVLDVRIESRSIRIKESQNWVEEKDRPHQTFCWALNRIKLEKSRSQRAQLTGSTIKPP